MVVRCYCCKKRFKSELQNCPQCKFLNLKHQHWLPEELKIKHAENHKPVIEIPTVSEIEQYTFEEAKTCQFEITGLKVTDNFEGVIEVLQPDNNDFHKLEINFNPHALRRHTVKEIRAMIRHELMHPITMQESSKIIVSDGIQEIQNIQAGVQEAYDEMINYKEYSKRFPNDQDLHSMKQKMYTNFSIIFLTSKHMIENNLIPRDHPDLFSHALTIYDDAVYNFFEHPDKFEHWVNDNSAQALHEFLKWIHEDLTTIHENISNRDEMREIIFLTFKMLVTVSIDQIYTSNSIVFNQMYTNAYQHCQKHYTDSLGGKLLELWQKRFEKSPLVFS